MAAPNGTRIPSPDGTEDRLVFGKLTVTNQAGRICRGLRIGIVPPIILSIILLRYYFVIPRRGDIILAVKDALRDPLVIVADTDPSP